MEVAMKAAIAIGAFLVLALALMYVSRRK